MLHFTFSYRMEGVSEMATPAVVMQTYPPIHNKRDKKDILILAVFIPISISTIYWLHFIPLFPLSKIRCILHRLLARSFHVRKG